MRFSIGGRLYAVTISSRPILLDGQNCRAKIDFRGQRILICGKLPRPERRRELFHELVHCWREANGMPTGPEPDAEQTAALMDTLLEQFAQQGGDSVLESLDPPKDGPTNPNPSGAAARGTYAQCGRCKAPMAVGSIATDAPVWNAGIGAWVVARGISCEECSKVTTWHETATADGVPTGFIVPHPPPRVLKAAEAREWMREHAEAVGAFVHD